MNYLSNYFNNNYNCDYYYNCCYYCDCCYNNNWYRRF